MEFSLTVPSLLFSAISLIMLAYTNRFMALASLIRRLHESYQAQHEQHLLPQIANLRRRLGLIQTMQALGVMALLAAVGSMFLIFMKEIPIAQGVFGGALILLMASLSVSFWEILISNRALEHQLSDMEDILAKEDSETLHLPLPFIKGKKEEQE
ncbi:MAG: DUF2721 domain-containing protein [Bacteroidetes bacterium]|nr:MAG: DUF2721 domain-containing protein [Bacteroidota bacterium]